ncbi:helix-turn-helix protein [Nocardiopsis sp. Huas11]|uniref:helix-turn-helix domain-containing protein n=1 Tax=Nocardiopsis sp. Huas11 TaxID=2183912 RepID=UPI000EAED1BF|nr:helix-turn-helix domain-containing protein [Nocardiopsis sp. Huas11]RKS08851.1 helix-turn-helix protein [Nocardiopsis sp. Huas11]
MSGYGKWDRDDYIDRVGGPQEAERRRKALLARVDAQRLVGIGKERGLTQSDVAERMGVTKGRVSQIEQGEVFTVDAIARYVRALGGELRLTADFDGCSYTVSSDRLETC